MGRLAAVLAAGLIALAGATAGAHAQTLEDTCASAELVPGACVGISKITERAAAECRRAGVPDESCIAPMARRVMREEVRAHASSWLHRTLDFQYELGSRVPFRDAPWIGTHNSFNSTSEFPTVSHTDSNQQLSLTHQLRIDVRSLELDVHWLPSPHAAGQPAPVVCHGRGADELHAGCTTERLLSDTLTEITTWLRDHGDQVILLYIEDAVDAPEGYDPTTAVLDQGLRDERGRSLVYRPPAGGACTDLPLDLTREKVRAAGAQVVIVSGCGSGAAWHGLVFDWNDVHVEGGNDGYRDAPVCDQDPDGDGRPQFNRETYATKLVRFFEDSTWLSATLTGEGEGLTPEIARRMSRCGVDLFGFDQILPRDGRLDALAWSWAENEPSRAGDCTIQRGDGRWIARRCTKRHRAACRRPDGRWVLTTSSLPAESALKACRARGGIPALPRTAAENEVLRSVAAAAGADGVWLPA
ncbi:MAG TPA: hypothetical protein VF517_09880 [Thermoleophilaceae bacterium]